MMKGGEALGYEVSVMFAGNLIILLFQSIGGSILSWLLWVLSVTLVLQSYIDHCCIGWQNLDANTQFRRILWNALICVGAYFALRFSLIYFVPDVNVQSVASILEGIQKMLRIHNYYGFILYTYLYMMFYSCILGCLRAWVNVGYLIYLIVMGGLSDNDGQRGNGPRPNGPPRRPPQQQPQQQPQAVGDHPHTN